jgi:predicted MFS family arabinose efflux permease
MGDARLRRRRRPPAGPSFGSMPGRHRTLLGMAAFGAFWGTWGAVLPGVRQHAGVDDGELGLALLCIGAGALLSMRPAGSLVDRFGSRMLPATVAAFAACAVLPGFAESLPVLGAVLLLLGATSGAFDVAVNAEGVRSEAAGRPVLNLGHAAFSAAVVASSLLTGLLRTLDAGPLLVLTAIGAVLAAVAVALTRLPPAPAVRASPGDARLRVSAPLAVIGALAALAYFVENAWQNWSALQLEATLGAAPGLSALGPAVFAAAAACGRLFGQRLAGRADDSTVVAGGATVAAAGTLLAALAPSTAVALVGIAIAGAGTSVCAPTLISVAGRIVAPEQRGAAVSIVTTMAYLGFLVGPAAVGLAADATSLRTALAMVAGLAVVLAASALVRRRSTRPRG